MTMLFASPAKVSLLFVAVGSVLLSGCVHRATNPTGTDTSSSARAMVQVPDRYQVRFGDTVSGISARYGLNWREVSAINQLDANHTIRVGQWLTLRGASRTIPRVPYKPPQSKSPYYPPIAKEVPIVKPSAQPAPTPSQAQPPVVIAPVMPVPVSRPVQGQALQPAMTPFIYPAGPSNVVVKEFGAPLNNGKTEGIFLSGRAGDVVIASKTGVASIVRTGAGERPMIVLEHEGGYSTTYLDVHETSIRARQTIRAGDRLGVMTSQTASGLALFEFRVAKNGQYIDPISVLRSQ